jgi:hypothetical protein
MKATTKTRKNEKPTLDPKKLKKAQKILGTKTEEETLARAIDEITSEYEANRRAWEANERFLKETITKGFLSMTYLGT